MVKFKGRDGNNTIFHKTYDRNYPNNNIDVPKRSDISKEVISPAKQSMFNRLRSSSPTSSMFNRLRSSILKMKIINIKIETNLKTIFLLYFNE